MSFDRAAWHRRSLYAEFYRPLGVEDQITVCLPTAPHLLGGLSCARMRRIFGERERAFLNYLRPHLVQAYHNAKAVTGLKGDIHLGSNRGEQPGQNVILLNPDRSNPRHRPGDQTSIRAVTELGNLGTLSNGDTETQANAINASGLIVGIAEKYVGGNSDQRARAVLWGTDSVAIDLNTFTDPASNWTLIGAYGISDANWITGIGLYDPDGPGSAPAYQRAFLLQLPEPSTLALVAFAMWPLLRRRGSAEQRRTTPIE